MISDIDARQSALRADRSFIVQAPAGSGKTGLLVYRMLTLLSTVEQPEQVLAITFTRKAMSEMRERLLDMLKQAQRGASSEDVFVQQGIDIAKAVLKRDQQRGWRLLDMPQQLQIQTIDGFCAKLTGHMPWLSRLGDKARTTDKPQNHYAAAVEQLFNELIADISDPEGQTSSELSQALQVVLLELDYNYTKARKLFIAMLAKRDQWLRHLLQGDLTDLRLNLEQTWHNITQQHLHTLNALLPSTMQQQLAERVTQAAALIEKPDTPLAKLNQHNQANTVSLSIDWWRAVKFLLLTNDNKKFRSPRGLNKNCGFPATDKKHKELMSSLLADLEDDHELRLALTELDHLPEANFSDDDWQQLCALEKVLKALAALLQLRFRAVGECDHSEVTQRANLALQDLSSPTELALRMDYQIRHILVDEFQDTSHSQIALLKKLTLGWADSLEGSQAQTLFLVGDPMQSIYRFREADVSLFLRASDSRQSLFPNIHISALKLTENFRSTNELVSWFNQTFASSFPKQNHVLSGAISYANATSSKALNTTEDVQNPSVQCIPVLDKQQEAQQVVVTLQRAQARFQTQQNTKQTPTPKVAILVRNRSHLSHILPALQAANIAYQGVDIQPLKETQAVLDVLALCNALCRLDDRVAWLALLRGPWCGLTLAEIQTVLSGSDVPIFNQLQQAGNLGFNKSLSKETETRLRRFFNVMTQAQQQRQQVNLSHIIRWAWHQLGGEHTLFDASLDDIEALFELIQGLEQGGDIVSVLELEQAIEGLYAQPAQSQQADVIVSTIHKAKGLQYDTVILPGLANPARADEKNVMMWAEHIDQTGSEQLLLAPIRLQEGEGQHYDYLRALEKKRSQYEAIRLMYVACTRAEKALILLGTFNFNEQKGELQTPRSNSLLGTVWSALGSAFEASFDANTSSTEMSESELPQTLLRLPSEFTVPAAKYIGWQTQQQLTAQKDQQENDYELEYDWASSVAKAVGIVLHDWLQFNQANLLETQIDQRQMQHWRNELITLNVPAEKINTCLNRLQKAVTMMQRDEQAHFIFKNYAEQKNEYTLSCLEDGIVKVYRIDRTFVDDKNIRWIVDYKTTVTHNDDIESFVDEQIDTRHRQQLNKYAELLSQIDQRQIKLCVYFPLLKVCRVWDYK